MVQKVIVRLGVPVWALPWDDWKNLLANPAINGGTILELGKDKAAKGEGWSLLFISYAQDTVGL